MAPLVLRIDRPCFSEGWNWKAKLQLWRGAAATAAEGMSSELTENEHGVTDTRTTQLRVIVGS